LWSTVAAGLIALSPFGAELLAHLPPCPVKAWVGLPCPTCGSGRAALALAELDLTGAFLHSPLATFGWLALLLGGFASLLLVLSGRSLPRLPRRLGAVPRVAAALTLFLNWLYLMARGG
jgi:hypothetical protein